jgi:hypothetical protein
LIVLAIAGLILLVVFLAVPALQRNSNNTTAKSDVASLLGGMNEYVNNNNGALPASSTDSGNTETFGATGTNQVPVKLGYYQASDVTLTTTVPSDVAVGKVVLVKGAVCDGITATTTGASGRNFVAVYTLEGGAKQCTAS